LYLLLSFFTLLKIIPFTKTLATIVGGYILAVITIHDKPPYADAV